MFGMKTRIALTLTTLALVLIGACSKQERVREIDWAKAALARNPAMEILSTDETAGIFTVRDTSTGTVRTLRLEDLVAGPPPPKVAAQPAAPAAPAAPAPEPAATPGEQAEPQTTETVAAAPSGSGQSLAEGPGYSISRGQPAAPPPTLEGPGYSITRDEPVRDANAKQSAPNAEAIASNVEKRTDPIRCQGDRLMRIDGETIEFEGDAVIAENGCDLYISNARIMAGGVGIIARQARVHIVNSTIGGSRGSYEASDGAEIYVASSTFSGIGRRFDSATMNDLGGNEYQLHD
jgi:hypothetical protein